MTPEFGHFALALALALALVQSVLPILGAARGNLMWMRSARHCPWLNYCSLAWHSRH